MALKHIPKHRQDYLTRWGFLIKSFHRDPNVKWRVFFRDKVVLTSNSLSKEMVWAETDAYAKKNGFP